MRIYHRYYRQKNPRNSHALRGDRKKVYDQIADSLGQVGGVRRNPGEMIDAFNILGEINRYIDDGHDELIPLRDIVSARIDGYLSKDAMNYSVAEAIRNLSAAQVKVVKQMIADAGGEVSPEERRMIDVAAGIRPTPPTRPGQEGVAYPSVRPSVLRASSRLEEAERAEGAFRAAIRAGQLSATEFQIGPERLEAMAYQQRSAREELGSERYKAEDEKLWKEVARKLERKYPEKYIPPKSESKRREEFRLLVKMSHRDTPDNVKKSIKKRLQTAISNRWQTARILAYEAAGGRESYRGREVGEKKKDGIPFPLGPGFFGVVLPPKQGKFKWILFDKEKTIYMQGESDHKGSAVRDAGIAYRVLSNLTGLDDAAGWDNLPNADIRWLEAKMPSLSVTVARMLLLNVNERRRVSRDTAVWLSQSAKIPKVELSEVKDVSKICSDMTTGEERIFPGEKNLFDIYVKKGAGGKFSYFVKLPDGRTSAVRRMAGCDEIIQKASVVGGAMIGGIEVARAIPNPQKIKRLEDSAQKYFRKQNPKMRRQPAEVSDIRELTGMIGVPPDPKDAYRYGFYAGIIRGIDTCGVQNYFKRKKIRNTFQERLLSAAMETTALVTGTRATPKPSSPRIIYQDRQGSKRAASDSGVDDIDLDLDNLLSGWRSED